FRWALILIASYWFYMSWNVKYIVLILFTTIISYMAGIFLERYRDNKLVKKFILAFTLIACLGVLFVFKYFNFFAGAVVDFLNMFALHLHPATLTLLLPVGISFYTFQTLAYVIDVYRGNTKAEHHFGVYAAFISFFPQLVAGPIERTNNLLPQIKAAPDFNYAQATYGMKLMTWGFFKKLAVADVVAVYSDRVFNDVYTYKGFALVLAMFFFTVQIYCDFSGYSDIARGCAKLFGIDLMENFKSPYFSATIREFWSRWHISLSTWFRDYVYIPLGGNRCGKFRRNVNLMITFIVSGLWHGANWTFIAWGAVHGLAQVVENAFIPKGYEPHGVRRALRVCGVFGFCMLAWVLFRANSISEALYVFAHAFDGITGIRSYLLGYKDITKGVSGSLRDVPIVFIVLAAYDYFLLKHDIISWISCRSVFLRRSVYVLFIIVFLMFLPLKRTQEFIYFQF
ncbi:MAG: MBOAT family protein, partial [Synergistaceae bacterium]|nr:MBOAT family protein [Synergistaceae bacterium]